MMAPAQFGCEAKPETGRLKFDYENWFAGGRDDQVAVRSAESFIIRRVV